jgi:hypothetical protein
MNLLNLDDKTRIRILKGFLLATAGSTWYWARTSRLLRKKGSEAQSNVIFAVKVIKRFEELAGPEITDKVGEELQFDWIVKDLKKD